jgi:hypothetical protein
LTGGEAIINTELNRLQHMFDDGHQGAMLAF